MQAAAFFRKEVCSRLVAHWSSARADRWLKAERFPRLSHPQQKLLAERLSKAQLIRLQITDIDNDAEAVGSVRMQYDEQLLDELKQFPRSFMDYIRLDFAKGVANRWLAGTVRQMRELSEPTRLLEYFPAGVEITRWRFELLLEIFAVETHMLWYLHDFYKALGLIEARDQASGIHRSPRWYVLAAARFAAGLPNDSFDENLPWIGSPLETHIEGASTLASTIPELERWTEREGDTSEVHSGPLYCTPSGAAKDIADLKKWRDDRVPLPVHNFLDEYLEAVNLYQLRPIQALGAMAHELQEWANLSYTLNYQLDRRWLAAEQASLQSNRDKDGNKDDEDKDKDYARPD